jgi:heat shock protein HtpX
MSKNTIKTYVLLAALGGLLILFGQLLYRGTGAFIGLALGLIFVGGSYWFSDRIAVAAARAKPVSEREAPELYRMVRELTLRANMPMPKLYVTPDMQPNAFATGRDEHHAAVAVTRGITELLTEEELRAVLAHELSHVANKDILIGSVAAAIAMGITYLGRVVTWGAMFGGMGGRDDRNGNALGLLVLALLAPIAAFVLQMAVSRSREYEADRSGAGLLGTGEPLARALEKLQAGARRIPMNVDPAHATMYIVNPLTGRNVSFKNLFMTHPPIEERVARLRGWRPY